MMAQGERTYTITIDTEGPAPAADLLDAFGEMLGDLGARGPSAGFNGRGPSATFGVPVWANTPHDEAVMACASGLELFFTAADKVGLAVTALARVEVLTEDQLERFVNEEPEDYLGVSEVAHLLDVSKQRVSELRSRPGFPDPVAELAAGPVWAASSLRRFIERWPRRPGRPRAPSALLDEIRTRIAHAPDALPSELTEREATALQQIAFGRDTNEVAHMLNISPAAVRAALRRALGKIQREALTTIAQEADEPHSVDA